MRIDGTYTKTKKVVLNVSPWEVFYGLRAEAYKRGGINEPNAFVSEDGKKIMYEEEIQTSHTSYCNRVLIEKPTMLQLELVRQFRDLNISLGRLDL